MIYEEDDIYRTLFDDEEKFDNLESLVGSADFDEFNDFDNLELDLD